VGSGRDIIGKGEICGWGRKGVSGQGKMREFLMVKLEAVDRGELRRGGGRG